MNFAEKIIEYVEKILSPYQVWVAVFFLSGILLFLPTSYQEYFKLSEISSSYRGYISIAFFIPIIIFITKTGVSVFNCIKSSEIINVKYLNEEERAILCFYILNQYQGARLREEHPAIISLKNRNLISIPYTGVVYITGSKYEYFTLTNKSKSKLKSNSFQEELFRELSTDNILKFINTISEVDYHLHHPETLSAKN
ncbi:super-infection exclusion protein B [Roseibium sp. TrichSKD4]|uniref:super-infection exclusion protein B n=1 Tax=Roseibium sp. TrichSKD4 TaxID=744980 RepID=UPI00111291F3|nr:super-infection exclusion protein B [Roseibium sp. TrichSKD4]